MPFDCPACGKENADDAKACAFCPESFPDEDDELRKPKFKTIDPGTWSIKRWLFIFMLIGVAIWRGFAFIAVTLEKGAGAPLARYVTHKTSVDDIINQDPNKNGLNKAMEIMLGTAPPTALAAARQMRQASTLSGASPFGRKLEDKPGSDDSGPRWQLKGTVYDITTLAPVANCELTFVADGKRYKDRTDDNGRYSSNVPVLDHGGYDVLIAHAGYARTYLNPAAENVQKMSAEDRKDMAHDLARADEGPYQVQPAGDATPLETDFYIAPKSAAGE